MIEKIDSLDIVAFIAKLPEQSKYDCKADLHLSTDEQKSELIKDIVAIANAHGNHTGYLFFGVDLAGTNQIVGMTNSFDDATLQQIVQTKLEKPVGFIYYEQDIEGSTIGVAVIPRSEHRPHIVRASFGRLRDGQIPIRRGSSTSWASSQDLGEMLSAASEVKPATELSALVKRASSADAEVSSLALDAWALWMSLNQTDDAEWVRQEIAGYGPDDREGKMPDYRLVQAWVTSSPLNPYALRLGGLGTIAQMPGANLQESDWSIGHSLAQLEQMVSETNAKPGVLHRKTRLPTSGGGETDAWVYFEPESIQRILIRVRDGIVSRIMATKA